MIELQDFLLPLEELTIKSEYQELKEYNQIDKDLIPYIDLLNSVPGLVTLYSCQSHPERNKNTSYLIIKCSEEMCYPLTEAIHSISDEMDITVEWNSSVEYKIFGIETKIESVIAIYGGTDYSYFDKLVNYLVDWYFLL